ncbi:MAG: class I SAM-dependent methyltransferase [Spirochaetales bacterium]|nr:class I SAM-dependent methyltransferase [Spirochaetales bacterium]
MGKESRDWYNSIAQRNGGYKSDAQFTREGLSGEVEFEKRLMERLPSYDHVLDIGCGHGEFTLKMAHYTKRITGGDNAEEMIKIARNLLDKSTLSHVDFLPLWTHQDFPFPDETFDFIYNRRGPTSILRQARILKRGGRIFAIHPEGVNFERIRTMMEDFGFDDLTIEEFNDCYIYFENLEEMGKFLAASHCNPDYTLPEHRKDLEQMGEKNLRGGRLALQEKRYIWSVRRK